MDNEQLQQLVEALSLEFFDLPFLHKATFNARLKATGGRYFTKSHHIEISPHQLTAFGLEETVKIIKHELCHYHLHIQKRGYQHRDQDFKQLLAKVGGSRYCQTLPERKSTRQLPVKYILVCQQCDMIYYRKRKMDVSKYRCGKCSGKLFMKQLDIK